MRMNKKQYNPAGFDLDLFLPYLLNQAAEVTSRSFQKIYRVEYGMTRTQWRVMANLSKHGSMTAVEICRRTFIEKTKISRAVQALQEKGFLTRAAIIGDRRAEWLSLTSEGSAVCLALGKRAAAFDLNLRNHLGREAADTLVKVLRTLMEASN